MPVMPIEQPDGNKVPENCCANPRVVRGSCQNCGYNWSEVDNWVEY